MNRAATQLDDIDRRPVSRGKAPVPSPQAGEDSTEGIARVVLGQVPVRAGRVAGPEQRAAFDPQGAEGDGLRVDHVARVPEDREHEPGRGGCLPREIAGTVGHARPSITMYTYVELRARDRGRRRRRSGAEITRILGRECPAIVAKSAGEGATSGFVRRAGLEPAT